MRPKNWFKLKPGESTTLRFLPPKGEHFDPWVWPNRGFAFVACGPHCPVCEMLAEMQFKENALAVWENEGGRCA